MDLGVWVQHTASFSLANLAARLVHSHIHTLRSLAARVMFGASCPDKVLEELIQLPISPDSLFGPQLLEKFQHLASNQATFGLVSSAIKVMGGTGLLVRSPSNPPSNARLHTGSAFSVSRPDWETTR